MPKGCTSAGRLWPDQDHRSSLHFVRGLNPSLLAWLQFGKSIQVLGFDHPAVGFEMVSDYIDDYVDDHSDRWSQIHRPWRSMRLEARPNSKHSRLLYKKTNWQFASVECKAFAATWECAWKCERSPSPVVLAFRQQGQFGQHSCTLMIHGCLGQYPTKKDCECCRINPTTTAAVWGTHST